MKVPLSLLKEYLDITPSAEELANVLTMAGIEVEKIASCGSSYSGVVVGYVREAHPHPHADRLKVATISDGREEFQVVCGASNCRAGIKVAFAKMGACLTDSQGKAFKIKKSKLRDIESFGMLCSADELGLGTSEGILELAETWALGTSLESYYGDTIFDVSLTPNLGHCMSILGIARELAAHLNLKLKEKNISLEERGPPIEELVSLQLIDQRQCPRYACRAVLQVKVGPSPEALRRKIEACGIRSINTIVDVGNLVMFELGQPLHMFDYDKIEGKKIVVTSQTGAETLLTLDGMQRTIFPESLLICDAVKPLAIGGVIGGLGSAITEDTSSIVIEAAYFLPTSIRKTSKLMGVKTDSSQRFEKGIDPNSVAKALDYAAFLVQKYAGGSIATGMIDQQTHVFHEKKIHCHTKRVNGLLGTLLGTSEIADFLTRLGMTIVEEHLNHLVVSVPTYRHDISIEEDLIEEVARMYGYSNIDKQLPKGSNRCAICPIPHTPLYLLENGIRHQLVAAGLQEFMTCDLISPSQAQMGIAGGLSPDALIQVKHAYSEEQSLLRTTLLPGLLQVVKYNIDHGNRNILGFELGRVHFKEGSQYLEPSVAAIVLTGAQRPYHFDPKPRSVDFFDLKGIIENLFTGLNIEDLTFEISHLHNFHPGRQARIKKGSSVLGVIAQVHPEKTLAAGIDQPLFFAEINLFELMGLLPKQLHVKDLPSFPGSERDWTITLKDSLPISHILGFIAKTPSGLLEQVVLLDLYKSEQIGKDKKNATFRFFYRDKEKTVAFEEVEKEHARITSSITLYLESKGCL